MRILLIVLVVGMAGVLLYLKARRRAERAAAVAEQARVRLAQRNRIPVVSNNVKGVTASQTIESLPGRAGESRDTDRRRVG